MESAFTQPISNKKKKNYLTVLNKPKKHINQLSHHITKTKYGKKILITLIALPFLWFVIQAIIAPTPSIDLQMPQANAMNDAGPIYVKGLVNPAGATIKVNGKSAKADGSGLFTTFVDVPGGKSTLQIDAWYYGRHASFVEPIARRLTPEEQLAVTTKKDEQDEKIKKKVQGKDSEIQSMLSQTHDGVITHIVRVIHDEKKQDGQYTRILGEVRNETEKNVSNVKVTANFYDINDKIVDSKSGPGSTDNIPLKPRELHSFITQASNIPFLYYKLVVDWQDENSATNSAGFNGNATNFKLPSPTQTTDATTANRNEMRPN